jgi:hypothetical protein
VTSDLLTSRKRTGGSLATVSGGVAAGAFILDIVAAQIVLSHKCEYSDYMYSVSRASHN